MFYVGTHGTAADYARIEFKESFFFTWKVDDARSLNT